MINRITDFILRKRWAQSLVMPFLSADQRERVLIQNIRNHLRYFGYSTRDYSDEEMKAAVLKLPDVMASCAMTTNEVAQSFTLLADAMDQLKKPNQ